MTAYDELENEEIIYYVYNLNWLLPTETQENAIAFLSQLPPEKADLLLPTYGKECWENGVAILKNIGYPNNLKALPKLARLLQDRNWPGSLEAMAIFKRMGKEHSTPFIEKEINEALQFMDVDWLEHLYFASCYIGIAREDFTNKDIYSQMQHLVTTNKE